MVRRWAWFPAISVSLTVATLERTVRSYGMMQVVIKRVGKNLAVLTSDAPEASAQLERDGYAVLRGVLAPDEVVALTEEIEHAFTTRDPERGRSDRDDFRYEMLNRSALCQEVIGKRAILDVIEPLLGEDCHVIANTCWRNPPAR